MEVNLNINEQEELYYFYHNWQAGQSNKIHRATCAFCTYGSGRNMATPPNRGENGVWIGPFSSLALCHDYVENKLGIPNTTDCTICLQ